MKLSPFINQVLNFIREHNLFTANDHCLLAVSGGADSIALLLVMLKLKRLLEIERLAIIHINHHLRGEESDLDEKFVMDTAYHFAVPYYLRSAQLDKYTGSLEEKARKARYEILEQVSHAEGFNKVVIAHNANDQAETIIFNMIRGGVAGLGGINPKRVHWLGKSEIEIVRPLLNSPREEIEEFLKEENYEYRVDQSNFSDSFTRNRIRSQILPLFLQENPNFLDTINRSSKVLREESAQLENDAFNRFSHCLVKIDENVLIMNINRLRDLSPVLGRRVLNMSYKEITHQPYSLNSHNLENIWSLVIHGKSNKNTPLPGNIYCYADRHYLIFSRGKTDFKPEELTICVKVDSLKIINAANQSILIKPISKDEPSNREFTQIFSVDEPIPQFLISNYDPELRIVFGDKSITVKKYMDDHKIPEFDRKNFLIISYQEKIIMIGEHFLNPDYFFGKKEYNYLIKINKS